MTNTTRLRASSLTRARSISAFIACIALPAAVCARTVTLPLGSFDVPDGLSILDGDEARPSADGSAIIVYGPKDAAPRAVFIVTYQPVPDGKPANDLLDAAVKIGNPMDRSLTAKDARALEIGGVPAGSYSGTLANGLLARSYVVVNHGYQLIVLLKGPDRAPYKDLMDTFAVGIEHLRWSDTKAPAPSLAASATVAPANALPEPATTTPADRATRRSLLDLLAGEEPISPERLDAYLNLALIQAPPQSGMHRENEGPVSWTESISKLLPRDSRQFKSLTFWTSVGGANFMRDVLRKNGTWINFEFAASVSFGTPLKKDQVPAVASQIAEWYRDRLRDRAR